MWRARTVLQLYVAFCGEIRVGMFIPIQGYSRSRGFDPNADRLGSGLSYSTPTYHLHGHGRLLRNGHSRSACASLGSFCAAEPYEYLFNTTHPAQAGTEVTVEALMAVVRRSTEAFHPELALGDPFFITLWEVRRPIECTLELRSSVFCSSRHRYRSLVQQRLRRGRPMHLSLPSPCIPTPNSYPLKSLWKM